LWVGLPQNQFFGVNLQHEDSEMLPFLPRLSYYSLGSNKEKLHMYVDDYTNITYTDIDYEFFFRTEITLQLCIRMLLAMYFTLTKTTLIATFGHKYNKSLMALKKSHAAKGNLKIHSILHSVYCLNYS
jgi:hypothetical protein